MINTTKVIDKRSSLVYIIPTKGDLQNIPLEYKDFVNHFIESAKFKL